VKGQLFHEHELLDADKGDPMGLRCLRNQTLCTMVFSLQVVSSMHAEDIAVLPWPWLASCTFQSALFRNCGYLIAIGNAQALQDDWVTVTSLAFSASINIASEIFVRLDVCYLACANILLQFYYHTV